MGEGVFMGVPRVLSGVRKLLTMMDWQAGSGEEMEGVLGNVQDPTAQGLVEGLTRFGAVGEDEVCVALELPRAFARLCGPCLALARLLTPSHAFSRLLAPSHAFSRLLTPSHAFARLRTPSHAFSRLLTPSHAFSRLATGRLLYARDGSSL